ncbi:MAG TPA: guanylate kinase [Gammaproteobacteria bacterium]|nr:guanylate kinase [Gammaproteobacteria bacterium]
MSPDARGRLWVMAAPSGAGKTSLARKLIELEPRLKFSISYTTRKQRSTEVDGRDYFFVDVPTFQDMVRRDAFLEHAQVFDNWYGTGRDHVEGLLAGGDSVLLEIDWQGARQVRERAPAARSIFILPPNVAELERRLRGRATDSESTIQRRLRDSVADMTHWPEFDHVVINDDFTTALAQLRAIVGGKQVQLTADPTVRRAAERVFSTPPTK